MKDGKLFLSSILILTHSNLLLDKSLLLHKQEVLRCSPKKKVVLNESFHFRISVRLQQAHFGFCVQLHVYYASGEVTQLFKDK